MSHDLGIDLIEAATKKFDESQARYPIEKSKGSSKKYTEFTWDLHIRLLHLDRRTRRSIHDRAWNGHNVHHNRYFLQTKGKMMLASSFRPPTKG